MSDTNNYVTGNILPAPTSTLRVSELEGDWIHLPMMKPYSCNDLGVTDTVTMEEGGESGDPSSNRVIVTHPHPPTTMPSTTATAAVVSSPIEKNDQVAAVTVDAVADSTTTSQTNGMNSVVPRRVTSFTRRHSIDNLGSLDMEPKVGECDFSGRRMDCNEDDMKSSSAAAPAPATTIPSPVPIATAVAAPTTKAVARICGSWRSKCGYCGGKRLHVLEVSDAFNKSLISTKGQKQQRTTSASAVDENGESTSTVSSPIVIGETATTQQKNNYTTTKKASSACTSSPSSKQQLPHIDALHTSKSYGLFFDNLPYEMYEAFVNRGWRRSGKDLYHPHSFESCCPAISIRLDVWKFGGAGGSTTTTAIATTTETSTTTTNVQPPSSSSHYHRRLDAEMGIEKEDDSFNEEEEDAAWTVTTRGSKSQRKVGRAILRALETYNSKCSVHEEEAEYKVGRLAASKSNGSNAAVEGVKKLMKIKKIGCQRQHKKSRQHSPERICMEDTMDLGKKHPSSVSSQEQPSHDQNDGPELRIGTNLSSIVTSQKRHPPLLNHEALHPYLVMLSQTVYDVVTMEAKNTLASTQAVRMRDNKREEIQPPRWAWWKDGVPHEEAHLPKWCSFKVLQSQGGCHCNANSHSGGIVVVASTPACAAVCGLSGGTIRKCQLSFLLVESLKSMQRTSCLEEVDVPRVLEVSVHEKSAHVHITLEVPPSMLVRNAAAASDQATQPDSVSIPRTNQRNPSNFNPISEFILRQASITHQLSGIIPPSRPIEEIDHPLQRRYLNVRSVPVHESTLQPEVHQLYCRYQSAIHGDVDPFFGCDAEESIRKNNAHEYCSYRRKYNPPGFLDVDAVYGNLGKCHRAKIKLSYLAFYRFLGETPVAAHHDVRNDTLYPFHSSDIRIPYGTYHQQYRLSTSKDVFDGPLIAVGVTDILPHCLSSVYSFYDPILSSKLELGKYTALREIEWVRRASRLRSDLHYYYLGYYIHCCKKMSYKAEFKPSELLCPVHLKWVDFDFGKKRLEEYSPIRQCCSLFVADSTSETVGHEEESTPDETSSFRIEEMTLDIGEKEPCLIQVGMLNKQGKEIVGPVVREFVKEVGSDLCHEFIIKLRQ